MSDDKLINHMRECWQQYKDTPDTAQGLGKLNAVSYMGERMGAVIAHIDSQESEIAQLCQQVADLQAQLDTLTKRNEALQDTVVGLQGTIKLLDSTIVAHVEHANDLQAQLAEREWQPVGTWTYQESLNRPIEKGGRLITELRVSNDKLLLAKDSDGQEILFYLSPNIRLCRRIGGDKGQAE